MKVLVIEDQPSELKLTDHVLTAAGHQVRGLDMADQALEIIMQTRPEVIVLDMKLPGMDGLALVRRVKANPTIRDTIIVAVTSFPERYTKVDAMESGCDAYFVKPLSTRTLPGDLALLVESKAKGNQI